MKLYSVAHCCGRHQPIFCAMPPYILESIAQRGTITQSTLAIWNLTMAAQMRGERQAVADFQFLSLTNTVRKKMRTVYDAKNLGTLPGAMARREGEPPTGDPAVDEAFEGAGATYDLFWEVYGRNSVDGEGLQLDSTVHYQTGYDNAFWNGQQMVYGDGDEDLPESERLFNRFTSSVDIIGHELTHGVIQYSANLNYWGQSGALNESYADVYGALVKQRLLGQTAAEADWLIGSELITPKVNGRAIRSMAEPGTAFDDDVLGIDPQPGHMRDFVETDRDSGGVHINSGIPNRAFFLAARDIGGFAWEKAGQIWYEALTKRLRPTANFQQGADATYAAAGSLYGQGSLEQKAVAAAWRGVGIEVSAAEPPGDGKPKDDDTSNKPVPKEEPSGCFNSVLGAIGLMKRP